MSKIVYVPKRFSPKSKKMIQQANEILNDYAAQGFILTLRQLYYQFVARDIIPNQQKAYKALGAVIGDARLAGRIDWAFMEDRTRNLQLLQHFSGPQDALDKLKDWYHVDMWSDQQYRPEVWIEKDALAGVIQKVCDENDVPYFSCRGYTSLSEMWSAAMRLKGWMDGDQKPYIIHFGDHDPSGIDMSRDIYDRIHDVFMSDCEFERVALTMEQIEEYQPPPNPAKVTDSRYKTYLAKYGDESWELDALEPKKFRELIEAQLKGLRDEKKWKRKLKEKEAVRQQLQSISVEWESIPLSKRKIEDLEKEVEVRGKLQETHEATIAKLQEAVRLLKRKKGKL